VPSAPTKKRLAASTNARAAGPGNGCAPDELDP
jgi:hypothetical protein